jgi:hypothetical protein
MEDMVMAKVPYKTALIAGVGPGIIASRASSLGAWCGSWPGRSRCRKAQRTGRCDRRKNFRRRCLQPFGRREAFPRHRAPIAEPDVVIYNASSRVSGKLTVLTVAWGMAVEAQSWANRDDLHRTVKLESSRAEN